MMIFKSQVFVLVVCWMTALLLQGVDAGRKSSKSSTHPPAESKKLSTKVPKGSSSSSSKSKSSKKSKSTKSGGKKGSAPTKPAPTMSPIGSSGTAAPSASPVSAEFTKAPTQTIPVTPAPVAAPPTGGAVVYLNNAAAFEAAAGGPFTSGQCEDFSNYNPSIDVADALGFEDCNSPLSSTNKCPYDVAISERADTGDGYISILPGFEIAFPQTGSYVIITQADGSLPTTIVAIAGNGQFQDEPVVFFSDPVTKVSVKLFYESTSSTGATLVVYGAGDTVLASQNLLVNGQPIQVDQTLEIGIVATQTITRFEIKDSGGDAFYQLCFRA